MKKVSISVIATIAIVSLIGTFSFSQQNKLSLVNITKQETETIAYRFPAVPKIKISPTSVKMRIGDTKQLKATISPSDYRDENIEWSTSNHNIVDVDDNGLLYAHNSGTATIKAKMSESDKVATIKVKVEQVYATKVIIENGSFSMNIGQKETLNATVEPNNVSNSEVTWKSSNSNIVSVNKEGIVTAKKSGKVTITATSKDKRKSSRITITVNSVPIQNMYFKNPDQVIKKNKTVTLILKTEPSEAEAGTIRWSSSNSSIATVNNNGKVTGRRGGTVTITASSNKGYTLSTTVTVDDTSVESITIDEGNVSLNAGDLRQLHFKIEPQNVINKSVTWSSSNSKIVSVTSLGQIRAIKPGTATITVKTNNNKRASITVRVNSPDLEEIYFDSSSIDLEVKDSHILNLTVIPNILAKDIIWSSDNKKVATVDNNGKVKTLKEGVAVITAKVKNSSKKATIRINVIDYDGLKLNMDSLALDIGEAETINVLQPEDATVTYRSSNSAIASVNGRGKVVGQRAGSATITAKLKNGKTATVVVDVRNRKVTNPEPTDVYINLKMDDIEQISVPGLEIDYETAIFESSNSEVVEIDEMGYMTAVGTGEADIVITDERGRQRVVYVLVRGIAVTQIKVATRKLTLYVGENEQVDAYVLPIDATNQELIWETSNDDVASVDDDGTIYANSKGSATIRIYSHDRKKKTTISIRVKEED